MKYVYAQTVLTEEKLNELRQKTGLNTRRALIRAIEHYLECPFRELDIAKELVEKNLEEIKKLRDRIQD
jgi:predicted DNA-binding protein